MRVLGVICWYSLNGQQVNTLQVLDRRLLTFCYIPILDVNTQIHVHSNKDCVISLSSLFTIHFGSLNSWSQHCVLCGIQIECHLGYEGQERLLWWLKRSVLQTLCNWVSLSCKLFKLAHEALMCSCKLLFLPGFQITACLNTKPNFRFSLLDTQREFALASSLCTSYCEEEGMLKHQAGLCWLTEAELSREAFNWCEEFPPVDRQELCILLAVLWNEILNGFAVRLQGFLLFA